MQSTSSNCYYLSFLLEYRHCHYYRPGSGKLRVVSSNQDQMDSLENESESKIYTVALNVHVRIYHIYVQQYDTLQWKSMRINRKLFSAARQSLIRRDGWTLHEGVAASSAQWFKSWTMELVLTVKAHNITIGSGGCILVSAAAAAAGGCCVGAVLFTPRLKTTAHSARTHASLSLSRTVRGTFLPQGFLRAVTSPQALFTPPKKLTPNHRGLSTVHGI